METGRRKRPTMRWLDMMQSESLNASERAKLITLLPRLRRFATVIAGDKSRADDLLRAACKKMLSRGHTYQRGTAFDIWAFRELHANWLGTLRTQDAPITQSQGDAEVFTGLTDGEGADIHAAETAEILAKLPPQQRGAALLIYGEGLSYHEAAEILDASAETVMTRVSRALASFVERAHWLESVRLQGAEVQQLNQINRQAG